MPQLRDYQEQLVTDVRTAYREGYKRPCIVLPCGGGKSCITAEIARRTTEKGTAYCSWFIGGSWCSRYRIHFTIGV